MLAARHQQFGLPFFVLPESHQIICMGESTLACTAQLCSHQHLAYGDNIGLQTAIWFVRSA